jgi:hyperosmotically inducible periplasmic protein
VKRPFSSWVVAAAIAVLPLAACGERADQPNYASQVNDRLSEANIDDVRANWENDERALRLTGEVESAADKARAEELAQQVVGTSGRVVNEVKIEGSNIEEVDNRVEEQLGRMFEDRTEWDFDGRGVSFDSNAGVVTITGNVESEAIKTRIGQRAAQVQGVRDVVNNLEVDAPGNRPGQRNTRTPPNNR